MDIIELTERHIKISILRLVGHGMEGLVGVSEGVSTDSTPNFSQNPEENWDYRPHLFVLAILMTPQECSWVSVFSIIASG